MASDEEDRTEFLAPTEDAGQPAKTQIEARRTAPDPPARQETSGRGVARTRRLRWLVIGAVLILLSLVLFYSQGVPVKESVTKEAVGPADIDPYGVALALAESSLAENDTEVLPARLLNLARRHEHRADLRELLDDATHYRRLLYLQQQQQLLAVATARGKKPFATALFEQAAMQHIDAGPGTAASLERLAQADKAWRSGELVEALTIVKQLSTGTAARAAAARLNRYTRVIEEYEILSAMRQSPDYPEQVLAFYLDLDPLQDRFYWQRLDADFEHSSQPVAGVSEQLKRAAQLWDDYKRSGGIDGKLRQQATPSDAFARRAGQLSEAQRLVSAVLSLQEQLPEPTRQLPLFQSILNNEVLRQRELLEILLSFNDDAVLAARLQMLTEKSGGAHAQLLTD